MWMGNTRWLGLLFLAVLAGTAGCLSRQYNEPEGGAESQYTQGRAPYVPGNFTIQYRDSRGEGTPYYNFPGHTYMLLGWIDPVGFNPRRARVVDNQGWNHFRRVITNQEDHQWPCWYFMRAPRG